MAISFFSVYPMEGESNYYFLDSSTLKGQDILSRNSFCADWRSKRGDAASAQSVSSEHPIRKDGGVNLMLAALQVSKSKETSGRENEKILKSVRDGVRDGISVTSYFVYKQRMSYINFCVCHSENFTSIFTSLKDFFSRQFTNSSEVCRRGKWLEAVCQGQRERQEEVCKELMACGLGDEFKSETASLIFSYISEETLIEQAKKKFDEELQVKDEYLFQDSRTPELALGFSPIEILLSTITIKTLDFERETSAQRGENLLLEIQNSGDDAEPSLDGDRFQSIFEGLPSPVLEPMYSRYTQVKNECDKNLLSEIQNSGDDAGPSLDGDLLQSNTTLFEGLPNPVLESMVMHSWHTQVKNECDKNLLSEIQNSGDDLNIEECD